MDKTDFIKVTIQITSRNGKAVTDSVEMFLPASSIAAIQKSDDTPAKYFVYITPSCIQSFTAMNIGINNKEILAKELEL